MHYNTLFQDRNLKNLLGRGYWGGRNPSPDPTLGASIVAPSALHTSCFRRSVLCVPYFQCPLLATLTVTNVVQGKRSQWRKFTGPPPIENPGYANGTHQLLRNFQLRHTVEAPPGIWPAKDKTERRYTIGPYNYKPSAI